MELHMRQQTETLQQVLEEQHERLQRMALSGDTVQRQILELTRSITSAANLRSIGIENTLQPANSQSLLSEPPSSFLSNFEFPSSYADPSFARALGNTTGEGGAMQGLNQTEEDVAEGLSVAWKKSWTTALQDHALIRVNVELIWADASKVGLKTHDV